MTAGGNMNPLREKTKNTGKSNYVIMKENANAYFPSFLLLIDLKSNCQA